MACPNKNLLSYQLLVKEFGEGKALAAWKLNNEDIPSIEEARNLFNNNQQIKKDGTKYEFDLPNSIVRGETKFSEKTKSGSQKSAGDLLQTSQYTQKITEGNSGFREENLEEKLSNNQKTIKNGLQDIISGKGQKREGDNIQTALDYFRGKTEESTGIRKEFQDINFKDYLEENNLLYEKEIDEKNFFAKGQEQSVYVNPENPKTVIKVNNGEHYLNWKEYLQNLLLHNYFFPDTTYKLLGFIENKGDVNAVVEQDYVNHNNEPIKEEELKQFFAEKGFEPTIGHGFVNKELGIKVDDLHSKNVVKANDLLFFIDTRFKILPQFYEQKSSTSTSKADKELNKQLESYINKLDGDIQYVDQLVVNGKVISGNAVTDVINRTVQVANGKESEDTLPEEVAHIYVQWLPEHSTLLRDMMKEIKNRPLYQQVMKEYSGDSLYQKEDGSVDTDKIAKEAIGKLIAGTIVGQYKDTKAKSLWQRLLDYIKNVFKGKDAFQVAASDILSGNTRKLDTKTIKAMKNAMAKGEYYLQKDSDKMAYIKKIYKNATEAQQKVIDVLILEPEIPVELVTKNDQGEDIHQYIDTNTGELYKSVTEQISPKMDAEAQKKYDLNRLWGNEVDSLLQSVASGIPLSKAPETPNFSDELREKIYNDLGRIFYQNHLGPQDIILTQVVVSDPISKTAGSIDILIVRPDGSLKVIDLKTYSDATGDKKLLYDSLFTKTDKDGKVSYQKLSTFVKHNIQVRTYANLLSTMGLPDAETALEYIKLKEDKATRTIKDFERDNKNSREVDNTADAYVNKLVEPLSNDVREGLYNPTHDPDFQNRIAKDTPEQIEEARVKLAALIERLFATLDTYKTDIETLKKRNAINFIDQHESRVDDLVSSISAILQSGGKDADIYYNVFLNSVRTELTRLSNYLNNPENASEPRFLKMVGISTRYRKTFENLIFTEQFIKTPSQRNIYNDTVRLLETTALAEVQATENAIVHGIKSTSTRALSEDAIRDIVKRDMDIGTGEYFLGSLGGNTLTDYVDNLIAQARVEIENNTEKITGTIKDIGKKLKDAGIKGFDWMMNYDSKGKSDGTIIIKTGSTYKKKLREVVDPLRNEDGSPKQYIPVTERVFLGANGNNRAEYEKNQQDLAYNIELSKLKKIHTKFREAENITWDSENKKFVIKDGNYHKYTDDFKEIDDKYRVLDNYGKWRLKEASEVDEDFKNYILSLEKYKELVDAKRSWKDIWAIASTDFQTKYFTRLTYDAMEYGKDENDEIVPTGIITKKADFFVKDAFIEIKDTTDDGTILVDPRWEKLMNPVTETDKLKKEFYITYRDSMQELVEKLPAQAMYWFERGMLPTIRAEFLQMLSTKGIGAVALSEVKNFFNVKAGIERTQETLARKGVPLLYMNALQDQEKIERLKKELRDLSANKPDSKDPEKAKAYLKKLSEKKDEISIEQNRMKAEELSPELVDGFILFAHMAENFSVMSSIEDALLNVQEQVSKMEFTRDGKTIKGVDSNTKKRMEAFMSQVFYNDESFTKSMAEAVTKKLMKLTSTTLIAFNINGMANNAIIARLNNRLDSLGNDFWDKGTLNSAIKEYTRVFIPGYIKTMGQKDKHHQKKAGSKYEALVRYYNMVKRTNNESTGRSKSIGDVAFSGYDAGEYMVQSQVGIAILKSIKVNTLDATGNPVEKSLYDCYSFDPNTGEIALVGNLTISDTKSPYYGKELKDINKLQDQLSDLKKGSSEYKEKQAEIKEQLNIKTAAVQRIWKTNERIHGNYDFYGKTVLEKYVVGRMAAQFHKWVYPNFKQRYSKNKWNEHLGGGMDVEGRYTTLGYFIKAIAVLKSRSLAWETLTKHQQNNLKKDMADLLYVAGFVAIGFLAKALADGIPDDDPYLKRMTMWVAYESSRGIQEVSLFIPVLGELGAYQLVKNPFAVMSTLGSFAILLHDMTVYPVQDEESRHYQRGTYKGELKVWKDIRSLIPGLREYNQIQNLGKNSTFFINSTM